MAMEIIGLWCSKTVIGSAGQPALGWNMTRKWIYSKTGYARWVADSTCQFSFCYLSRPCYDVTTFCFSVWCNAFFLLSFSWNYTRDFDKLKSNFGVNNFIQQDSDSYFVRLLAAITNAVFRMIVLFVSLAHAGSSAPASSTVTRMVQHLLLALRNHA